MQVFMEVLLAYKSDKPRGKIPDIHFFIESTDKKHALHDMNLKIKEVVTLSNT